MRIAHWRTESYSTIRQHAANRKKIREIKFRIYWRSKFEPRRLSAQGALLYQYIGAGIALFDFSFYLSVSILSAISVSQSLHLPPHLHLPPYLHPPCLLYLLAISVSLAISISSHIEITDDSKIKFFKDKRTSIVTVRCLYRMYATFPTPFVLIADYL